MTYLQHPNGGRAEIIESNTDGITAQWIMSSGWKHTVWYTHDELSEYHLEIIHQEAQEELQHEHVQAIERGYSEWNIPLAATHL